MNILEKAIKRFGKTSQKIVAIEELSELQKEITKDLRGKANIDHLLEEITDVQIMIDQLKMMYGIDSKMENTCRVQKIRRLIETMKECDKK